MPAKQEYLSSTGQRILKISAGILGGYMLAMAIHLFIAVIFPAYQTAVMLTATFSLFILWVVFMILAFMAKNGWKVWAVYLLATVVAGLFTYLLK